MLAVLMAGAFAGVARALDFDDEDPTPPHAEIGMVYSYVIGSHAGCLPHHLEILSGELPPGLKIRSIALDKSVVEGVATEVGRFSAWIALKDCDNKSAETLFTFDVWARRWGISTESLKSAAVGSPYSATLEGSGLPSDVTWEVTAGSLPAGLTLSPGGVIAGTATCDRLIHLHREGDGEGEELRPDAHRLQAVHAQRGRRSPRARRARSPRSGCGSRPRSSAAVGSPRTRGPRPELRPGSPSARTERSAVSRHERARTP